MIGGIVWYLAGSNPATSAFNFKYLDYVFDI